MRLLVYTVVFGGYDRVFPPAGRIDNAHCILVTDDKSVAVKGWHTRIVDPASFGTARAANRYFKMLGHRDLGDFDASIYIDGNIRLLGDPAEVVRRLHESGAALGVFPHPRRNSVAEEIEACIKSGKLRAPEDAWKELEHYRQEGFPDAGGLVEATILAKNHRHEGLDRAMELWHSLFSAHRTRDQISLPYVLWKTQLPCQYFPHSFREPNAHFGIYPHFGDPRVPAAYAYNCARSYDSRAHRACVRIWHAKWAVQRFLRRIIGRRS